MAQRKGNFKGLKQIRVVMMYIERTRKTSKFQFFTSVCIIVEMSHIKLSLFKDRRVGTSMALQIDAEN